MHVVVARKEKAFRTKSDVDCGLDCSASDEDGRSSEAPLGLLLLDFLAAWVRILRAAVRLRWSVVGASGLVLDVLVVHVHRLVDLRAQGIVVGGPGRDVSMPCVVVSKFSELTERSTPRYPSRAAYP